jgi:hypothetical protein
VFFSIRFHTFDDNAVAQPVFTRTLLGDVMSGLLRRVLHAGSEVYNQEEWRLQQTVLGVKPEGADFSRLDPAVCAGIIAQVERERALKMG